MSLLTLKTPAPPGRHHQVDGCSMNAMVDPAGTARGPRHSLSGCAPWITATQACLIIAMLVMAGGVMGWCRPAQGADQSPGGPDPAPWQPN